MPMRKAGELSDATYRKLAHLMYESIGLSLNASKKPLVSSRLAQRITRLGLDGYEAYFKLIASQEEGGEFQMAVDLLTTNETYFFREAEHFSVLEEELGRTRPESVSIWSAAASFGDESYSIAMLLADMATQGRIGPNWSILGTDISDRVLRSAKTAIYPETRLRHVSLERRRRYCLKGEGDFQGMAKIQDKLTEHVHFGQLNLCRPIEDIGPFDVVFLRNVLIYFDDITKREVVDRVLSRLRVGGLFFIGMAEGRVACDTPLESLSPGAFRKLASKPGSP